MLDRLLRWTERRPERIWAIEGATGLGHLLAQQLVARDEGVVISQCRWLLAHRSQAALGTP